MKHQRAIEREYSRLAASYDSRWSHYIRATTEATLARLDAQDAERILDLGCGTGVLLTRLGETAPHTALVGVDPVAEMLDVARDRLPADVELAQAWADQLPFPDGHFDRVVAANMFHYIAEPAAALREVQRVLKPRGSLVLTDWCGDYFTMRVLDRFLGLFNQAHYHTWRSGEIRKLLEANSYDVRLFETYRVDWFWGMMTLRAGKA